MVPNGCQDDYHVWVLGFQRFGTFDEVAIQYFDEEHPNHNVVHQCWNTAKAVMMGQPKPWSPHAVNQHNRTTVKIIKPMIGLTPQQFFDHPKTPRCTPEEAGWQVMDLPDTEGNQYKGVILKDPDYPYIRYEVEERVELDKVETLMLADHQLYADQPGSVKAFQLQSLRSLNSTSLVVMEGFCMSTNGGRFLGSYSRR